MRTISFLLSWDVFEAEYLVSTTPDDDIRGNINTRQHADDPIQSRDFFASPHEIKASTPVQQNRGYVSMNREALDPKLHSKGDCKEAFNFGEFALDGTAQQPLPKPLISHEATIGRFEEDCKALCSRILRLLAKALEIEEEWFAERHDRKKGESGSVLRLLHVCAKL